MIRFVTLILCILTLIPFQIGAQENGVIQGMVKNLTDRPFREFDKISFIRFNHTDSFEIYNFDLSQGVFYSLEIPTGIYDFSSYISGFEKDKIEVKKSEISTFNLIAYLWDKRNKTYRFIPEYKYDMISKIEKTPDINGKWIIKGFEDDNEYMNYQSYLLSDTIKLSLLRDRYFEFSSSDLLNTKIGSLTVYDGCNWIDGYTFNFIDDSSFVIVPGLDISTTLVGCAYEQYGGDSRLRNLFEKSIENSISWKVLNNEIILNYNKAKLTLAKEYKGFISGKISNLSGRNFDRTDVILFSTPKTHKRMYYSGKIMENGMYLAEIPEGEYVFAYTYHHLDTNVIQVVRKEEVKLDVIAYAWDKAYYEAYSIMPKDEYDEFSKIDFKDKIGGKWIVDKYISKKDESSTEEKYVLERENLHFNFLPEPSENSVNGQVNIFNGKEYFTGPSYHMTSKNKLIIKTKTVDIGTLKTYFSTTIGQAIIGATVDSSEIRYQWKLDGDQIILDNDYYFIQLRREK